jgi:hypothetical protein
MVLLSAAAQQTRKPGNGSEYRSRPVIRNDRFETARNHPLRIERHFTHGFHTQIPER